MTAFLPPNLLALFAPRDPIPFLPPVDKLPYEKKNTHNYAGKFNVSVLVFRTCDFFIRIRIRGSVPYHWITDPDPALFFSGFHLKKQVLSFKFKRESLNCRIELKLIFFIVEVDEKILIRTRIRIWEAHKLTDPDAEQCQYRTYWCNPCTVFQIQTFRVFGTGSEPRISVSVEFLPMNYKLFLKFVKIFVIVGYRTTTVYQ